MFTSLHIEKDNSPEEVRNIVEKAGGKFIKTMDNKGYKADMYDLSAITPETPNAIAVFVKNEFLYLNVENYKLIEMKLGHPTSTARLWARSI